MSQLGFTTQLITFQPRLKAAKKILSDFTQMHAKTPHYRPPHSTPRPRAFSTRSVQNNYSMLKPSMPHKKVSSGLEVGEKIKKRGEFNEKGHRFHLDEYQAFAQGKPQWHKQVLQERGGSKRGSLADRDSVLQMSFSRNSYSPQPLGPHININLQMLLRKRKPSASQLSKRHQLLLYSRRK